jgi:hypothetical protein
VKARIAWLVLCGVLAFVAIERPHLTRRWGLYLVAPAHGSQARSERLFLDPFPDQVACELEARNLEAEGSPAVCHDALSMSWGTTLDRTLATDFSGRNLLYDLYCTLRGISERPESRRTGVTRPVDGTR